MTDCLSVTGLDDLRGETFREWLCDIGLGKLQTALKDFDGRTLTRILTVSDIVDYDVSFNDAATLQLRGYIAHYKLSDDRTFNPPSDSVLSWDRVQTENWIMTHWAPCNYCLASAGWHGAALCSLSPSRVVETTRGMLKTPDAVKFIGLVRQMRSERDGDKDEWVAKWSGLNLIA